MSVMGLHFHFALTSSVIVWYIDKRMGRAVIAYPKVFNPCGPLHLVCWLITDLYYTMALTSV